jgi:hypothetical protein
MNDLVSMSWHNPDTIKIPVKKMARPERFELPTTWFVVM